MRGKRGSERGFLLFRDCADGGLVVFSLYFEGFLFPGNAGDGDVGRWGGRCQRGEREVVAELAMGIGDCGNCEGVSSGGLEIDQTVGVSA